MKTIKVPNPNNLPTMPWAELKKSFEANILKDKKSRKIGSLKASILKLGFIYPIYIWKEGKYIIDGAGRMQALDMLEYEGYEIPDIPYLVVSAKNKKEAKEQVVAMSSIYGHATEESMVDFVGEDMEMDIGFAELNLKMEEIRFSPKQKEKKDESERKKGKTVMMHTCPECGHEFN